MTNNAKKTKKKTTSKQLEDTFTKFNVAGNISSEEEGEDDEEYSEGKSGSDPEVQPIDGPSVSKKKSGNKRKISNEDLLKKLDSISSRNEKLLKKVERVEKEYKTIQNEFNELKKEHLQLKRDVETLNKNKRRAILESLKNNVVIKGLPLKDINNKDLKKYTLKIAEKLDVQFDENAINCYKVGIDENTQLKVAFADSRFKEMIMKEKKKRN
ncbi:hypothetical protein HHI36_002281 [Cryptolaemus montrouzieri]|uniref:Uncharacterized protein n=1 Tax=Cryptolaemus montrouzieri TaxID=559131 RepID=A0ABD2PAL2_9CUCU